MSCSFKKPFTLTIRWKFGFRATNDLRMSLSGFSFGDQQTGANQRRHRWLNVGDQCGVRVGAFLVVWNDEKVGLHFNIGHNIARLVLLVGGSALSIQNQIQTSLLQQVQTVAGDLKNEELRKTVSILISAKGRKKIRILTMITVGNNCHHDSVMV